MDWQFVVFIAIVLAALGLFLYWQLVVAEGAYLGPRVVALLYDWFAPRYDAVKAFDPAYDAIMLAAPVLIYMRQRKIAAPMVLDVGSGTGRLPAALLAQPNFDGQIVAVDLSPKMLDLAKANLAPYAHRVSFLLHDAQRLPFDDNHFDVVTSLEALEFFANPQLAVREMLRVLKPGGLLMLSNRIGPDLWKLPGRAMPTPKFVAQLAAMGAHQIQPDTWLIDYDLVRALK
ncbi:MAG: class I SAM-dependent methyltransferase [Anaerolineae bacterium]|nr:class I SAM-dependent methyltransferase [Anaerolineae bacterium]